METVLTPGGSNYKTVHINFFKEKKSLNTLIIALKFEKSKPFTVVQGFQLVYYEKTGFNVLNDDFEKNLLCYFNSNSYSV